RFPEFFVADSIRRQNSHSGDDDAISLHFFSRPCGMKIVQLIPAEKFGTLAANWLLIFSGTNESPGILNATLSPVIIFFALETGHFFMTAANLFTSCTLRAIDFCLTIRPAERDEFAPVFSSSSPDPRHAPSFCSG